MTVHLRVRDNLSRVLASYSVIISDKSANSKYTKEYTECKWESIFVKDLWDIKQDIVS